MQLSKLETERIILRKWNEQDAEACYHYAKNAIIGYWAGWEPHSSVEHSLNIIKTVLSDEGIYAIELKETSEAIGSIGFFLTSCKKIVGEKPNYEIGFWVGKPYWGQGIMPEATRLLINKMFAELDIDGIWCSYFEGNERSKKVQEKCGFVFSHNEENDIKEFPNAPSNVRCYNYLDKKRWKESF